MKKFLAVILVFSLGLMSCQTSEGVKYGTVQKVSHKTGICNYYVIEIAFEGGRVEGSENSKSYSNTQEIKIDAAAYDSLQSYLGEKVLFDYKDKGFATCGTSKHLTSIRRK